MKEDNYKNIELNSLDYLFSNASIRILQAWNIITVGDLLEKYQDIYKFTGNNISVAYKLLKCKYLGIDPQIEINDADDINEVSKKLSFNNRTTNLLLRSKITTIDLKKIIMENDEIIASKEVIREVRNCGEKTAREIVSKMSIVLNYYNNIKEENSDVAGDKSIYFELIELSKQVKELDKKIDSMLDRMLENMEEEKFSEEIKTYIKRK